MIQINSKEVKKGDTFIALKGYNEDGHKYIDEAIRNGALKVICEKGNYNVETIIVDDTKKYLDNYLKKNYYKKIKDLKLIGITGTNGKTTTAYLIYQALNKLNIKCAYIGTIGFYMKDKVKNLNNTTPSILEIYNMLIECKNNGIEYVVMEVSSHALSMGRVNTLKFKYGILTNLTIDHLDFHKTFDNYVKAKSKLFLACENSFINKDDKNYKKVINDKTNIVYYGYKSNNYKIINYRYDSNYMNFDIIIDSRVYTFKTKILGKYNIYNIIGVIMILRGIGIDIDEIIKIVEEIEHPKGRMDTIKYNNSSIIIDYAHTEDAIFKVINCVKEYTKGKIYCIIGCGGNRQKSKRPIMAYYATSLSDYCILTSDNPRFEDANDIIEDMKTGIFKDNYEVIVDRYKAIKRGIELLRSNDSLLILGKGHENYQIIKDKKFHHDDKECVMEIIDRVI